MIPEAQNIALAEACGWTNIIRNFQGQLTGIPPSLTGMGGHGPIPDYFGDLNAQFEAWQTLTEEQKLMFGNSVDRIALRDGIRKEEAQYRFGCECLLRALGKWIE